MSVVHLIHPERFVKTGGEWPWCGHGHYVPMVEHPDDATCRHCLRKFEASERPSIPNRCSMCERQPATTTYGLPVCEDCRVWLAGLDRHLRRFHLPQPERYIDRARRAIKERRRQGAAALAEPSDDAARPAGDGGSQAKP